VNINFIKIKNNRIEVKKRELPLDGSNIIVKAYRA